MPFHTSFLFINAITLSVTSAFVIAVGPGLPEVGWRWRGCPCRLGDKRWAKTNSPLVTTGGEFCGSNQNCSRLQPGGSVCVQAGCGEGGGSRAAACPHGEGHPPDTQPEMRGQPRPLPVPCSPGFHSPHVRPLHLPPCRRAHSTRRRGARQTLPHTPPFLSHVGRVDREAWPVK